MAEKILLQTQIAAVGLLAELIEKRELLDAMKMVAFRKQIKAALETLDWLDANAAEIKEALIVLRKQKNAEKIAETQRAYDEMQDAQDD